MDGSQVGPAGSAPAAAPGTPGTPGTCDQPPPRSTLQQPLDEKAQTPVSVPFVTQSKPAGQAR
jgi:hypothetical protein